MSIFSKIFGALWGVIKSLFESTQDAFKDLPKDQQQAILKGPVVAQIIKDNLHRGEQEVIDLVVEVIGSTNEVIADLFKRLATDLKVDNLVTGVSDKIDSGLTDLGHNALFENIAKFTASFFSEGKINWITLSLGVIEYAYQYLKSKNELPVSTMDTNNGDPVPPDPTHPPKP